MWLAIVSVIISIVSLTLSILLRLKSTKFRDNVVDIIQNSERVKEYLSRLVNEASHSNRQVITSERKPCLTDVEFDRLTEIVLNQLDDIINNKLSQRHEQQTCQETNQIQERQQVPPQTSSFPRTLYASAANNDGVFIETDDMSKDGKTVYEMKLESENQAVFYVINVPDYTRFFDSLGFLDHATEHEGMGRTRIETIEKGIAQRDTEGKWKVIKKAKIKFL